MTAATHCATVEAEDEETIAEDEPAETRLEETEEVEAESVEAQAEDTEAVQAEPAEADLEETEEAEAEEAAVTVAEPAEPTEITKATLYTSSVGIDLSSINLDKVKKHPSLYRRQKSEHHRPVQTSGQTRQRKKKVRTQHAVILRKERRLKSIFTEWNQATSPCG